MSWYWFWICFGIGIVVLLRKLLFFLELQQPGIGIFGIGALISFVFGGFMLLGESGAESG